METKAINSTIREVNSMDSTKDITIGQVVKSRAGRDKGNIFFSIKYYRRSACFNSRWRFEKVRQTQEKKGKTFDGL